MIKPKSSEIIQIVPQLPPSINGLGDYALNLARQLRQDYEIETRFVVGNSNWQGATTVEDFSIEKVSIHSAEALFQLLSTYSDRSDAISILLHYVGYGYAKRGCPAWLIEGLERWKNHAVDSQLVTMFHEIYASGKQPWTSVFWLSRQQRHLAARLAQLSDRCFTNKQLYAEILQQLSRGKHTQISTLPVFSNIGEPEQLPPLIKRHRRLVVFGGYSNRLQVYRKFIKQLSQACQQLGIEEIWDIGPSIGLTLSLINQVPIVEMGERSASEIGEILSHSLAGFFCYPANFLAKSGIFAAYCAHGLLPVSSGCNALPADGIEPGKHYLIPDDKTINWKDLVEMQAIADNAYTWYHSHSLSVHTTTFTNYLAAV